MTQLETRATGDDGKKLQISGYAAKFNTRSQLLYGEFYEVISPGAFARSLQDNTVKALWNHNFDIVLGSTKSGTLRLAEDDIGLRMDVDLPDNEWGRFAFDAVQRGDVDGVSFGFSIPEGGSDFIYLPDEGYYLRTLIAIDLYEVSPTGFPAYRDTELGAEQRNVQADFGIQPVSARNEEMRSLLCQIELMGV
ncbi:hypothetical protein SAMN02799624_04532 [Paenibacillus sp. UNC496MF]|uniref:HK97 family phage prohead protease n=1 Tax=Paenibacillus sp. UNC496MF TaxID=1502753 RepID=UPI0008F2E864|nr:HK97 family phage prohead protease [Paenibacillus sp. UNC496MF]SFJ44062.1 hypothetical protein SAMN02799624_04532 [Paenibacillus sp. UNC496MF]